MTQENVKESSVSTNNKESSGENLRHREKRDKNTPPTKVVIRRLPPTMTLEIFLEQIAPVPDNDYMYFVKADMSLGQHAFSRAYINFLNQEDIFIFKDKFDGYVFVDHKGNEYPAVVEFAPFQKIPKKKLKKKDAKCGTIEQDVDYVKFLESLQNPEEIIVPSAESYLEEIEARERELKANNGIPKVTTPLIEYLNHKKAERQRLREEKREERKRRELERKRLREEERKRRKAEKEKEREKAKEKLKESPKEKDKEKDDKKADEKVKSEPVLKLLKNPEREKEKEEKDKDVVSKEKPTTPVDKQSKEKEKHPHPIHDWEKDRRCKEEERLKQREKLRDRERERRDKDKFRKDRDEPRNGRSSVVTSYKSEKRYDDTSNGKYSDKEKLNKDDKYDKESKLDDRDKFRRPDFKIKQDRYRDDYQNRREEWNKNRSERRWMDDRYRSDSRRPIPKPFERTRDYNRDKFNRDDRTKDYKDKMKRDMKPRSDEGSGRNFADKSEKDERMSSNVENPKVEEQAVKPKTNEDEEICEDELVDIETPERDTVEDDILDKGDDGNKKGDDGKDSKQDPRMERRIRNKDRPSLEIYRPGMRRLSLQRNSPQKEVPGSPSSSSSPSPTPQAIGKAPPSSASQTTKVETSVTDSATNEDNTESGDLAKESLLNP